MKPEETTLAHRLVIKVQRWIEWLTLEGDLRVAQPLMLVIGPLLLALSLIAPYRWIYFLVYCFVLLAALCYGWVRYQAPRVTITRHLQHDWAQVGDELKEQWELT